MIDRQDGTIGEKEQLDGTNSWKKKDNSN